MAVDAFKCQGPYTSNFSVKSTGGGAPWHPGVLVKLEFILVLTVMSLVIVFYFIGRGTSSGGKAWRSCSCG